MRFSNVLLTACLVLGAIASAGAQNGRGYGNGGQNRSACCPRLDASQPVQKLSADEASRLLFMREEEKLALDVYQALSQKWALRVFSNIAAAEKRHFDAIGALIVRYGLSDPAMPEPGAFSNAELQKMFHDLISKGERSLADALEAGVIIEEQDIDDLKEAISTTDKKDIMAIYGNLMNGSLNHLSAFNRQLGAAGRK